MRDLLDIEQGGFLISKKVPATKNDYSDINLINMKICLRISTRLIQ